MADFCSSHEPKELLVCINKLAARLETELSSLSRRLDALDNRTDGRDNKIEELQRRHAEAIGKVEGKLDETAQLVHQYGLAIHALEATCARC